jgi:hypothetical protein
MGLCHGAENNRSAGPFGLDGVTFEIDLVPENAARLRKVLDEFVRSGRRVGGRKRSVSVGAAPVRGREQTQAIRDWAKQNGHQISDRGRIPGNVIVAFEAAQADAVKARRTRKN